MVRRMAQVTFDKIRKEYQDGTVAVPSLDLEIADGEFMVLVGPSGCGKSTALRMIAGLEEITEGTLNIGERTVNDLPPGERDVAMVFQNYALYPHMTVRGNMGFALEMAKVPKAQIAERVDKAAAILGLTAYLDRTPKALSGGQRQRVAMGRAIVREPSVFLMDEPLSNLDAKLRVQMRGEIIRLQRELATTMVYVTHDQVEAMTMGDRVAVMRKGLLQQVAPPQELYERPNNLFVAGFIGSPAMNFLTASLEKSDGVYTAHIGDQSLALDPRVAERHPRIDEGVGKTIIFGIRPEHFENPEGSVIPANQHLQITCDLAESMGAETQIHFRLPVPPAQFEGASISSDDEAVSSSANNTTAVIARFEGIVRVNTGDRIAAAVRTRHAHIFDAQTGLPLR
jgi:multiple sugar transport system ATP-binding protein